MTNLSVLRKKNGYSQLELSKRLGVKRTTVAMWENGTNVPRPAKLIQLAEIFGVTVDELLREGVKKDADRQ